MFLCVGYCKTSSPNRLRPSLHRSFFFLLKLWFERSNGGVFGLTLPSVPGRGRIWWWYPGLVWPSVYGYRSDMDHWLGSCCIFCLHFSHHIRFRPWDAPVTDVICYLGTLEESRWTLKKKKEETIAANTIMDSWGSTLRTFIPDIFFLKTVTGWTPICLRLRSSCPLLNARCLSRVGRISRILWDSSTRSDLLQRRRASAKSDPLRYFFFIFYKTKGLQRFLVCCLFVILSWLTLGLRGFYETQRRY